MTDAAIRYGLELDRHGMCLCPFHGEKSASFKIYPDGRGFYCFGCDSGGDVITFVEKLFGLSPVDAAKKLMADFGMAAPSAEDVPDNGWKKKRDERLAAQAKEEARLDAIYAELREIYHLPPGPERAAKAGRADYLEYVLYGY